MLKVCRVSLVIILLTSVVAAQQLDPEALLKKMEKLQKLMFEQHSPDADRAYRRLLELVRADPRDKDLPDFITPPLPPFASKEGGDAFNAIVDAYQQAVKKSPDDPDIRFNYARLLWTKSHTLAGKTRSQAIEEMEKAVKLRPNSVEFHSQLAHFYQLTDRQDQAITAYKEVLRLCSDQGDEAVQAHGGLGEIYFGRGKLKEALAEFQRVVELERPSESRSNRAYDYLGRIYLKQGDTKKAVEMLKKAEQVSLDPVLQSFGFECDLAIELVKQGIYDEPIHYFQTALKATPDQDEPRYGLALAYTKKGDKENALREWKKYLSLRYAPQDEEARRYVKELEGK